MIKPLLTFILTTFIAGYSDMNILLLVIMAIFCIVFSLDFKESLKKNLISVMICIFAVFIGVFINIYGESKLESSAEKFINENNGTVFGTVVSEPSEYRKGSVFYIKTDSGVKIRINYASIKEIEVGRKVEIRDFKPQKISTENKITSFARNNIGENCLLYAEVNPQELTVKDVSKPYLILNYAYKLKQKTFYRLLKYMKSDDAALSYAIFTSDKKWLSNDIYDMLIKTGTVHISTVSGFHFNLLSFLILLILKLFIGSHTKRITLTGVIMICFAFYTGLSISVIRALITFLAYCLCDLFDMKKSDSQTLFLGIIAFFILGSPLIIFDISFILTLVSNGALLFLSVDYDKQYVTLKRIYVPINSIIINLVMMPIVFSLFGRISMVSVLSNLLVDFTIGPILLLTGFVTLTSFILSPFAYILSKFLSAYIRYFLFILKLTSIPKNLNPHFGFDMVCAICIVILGILVFKFKKDKIKSVLMIALSLVMLVSNYIAIYNSDKIYMTLCGNYGNGVVISADSHHIVVASPDEFYYPGNTSALRKNEVVDLWISPDSFDSDIAEKLTEIYSIKKIVIPEKFKANDYNGSAELVIMNEFDEFNFEEMKIKLFSQYRCLNYFVFEHEGKETYFCSKLNFFYVNEGELNNCNVIYYGDESKKYETFFKYVDFPEDVNIYLIDKSFGKHSLGILNREVPQFK